MKNKTGEVKERGVFWLLFNNKPEVVEEDVIEKSKESEELKKSEERLQKMIDKYKIENFESFGAAKKTPRMKKAKIVEEKEIETHREKEEKQLKQEDIER